MAGIRARQIDLRQLKVQIAQDEVSGSVLSVGMYFGLLVPGVVMTPTAHFLALLLLPFASGHRMRHPCRNNWGRRRHSLGGIGIRGRCSSTGCSPYRYWKERATETGDPGSLNEEWRPRPCQKGAALNTS